MSAELVLRLANLVCHLLLLAIIEPIFFFQFAGNNEIHEHQERVQKLNQKITQSLQHANFTSEQQSMFRALFQSLEVENLLEKEKVLAQQGVSYRQQSNKNLLYFSIYIMLGIFVFLCLISYGAYRMNVKIPWKMLIFDNFIILIGICSYEFYFYYHVAAQFRSASTNEDLYLYSQTFYHAMNNKLQN